MPPCSPPPTWRPRPGRDRAPPWRSDDRHAPTQHHKLCHVLGGTFDLPHAATHTAVLPHVLALNLPAAPAAHAALQAALGAAEPALHLFRTARRLGPEMSLQALGLPADGLRTVIEQVLAAPYANPAPVTEADLRRLLDDALAGTAPRTRPERPTEDA